MKNTTKWIATLTVCALALGAAWAQPPRGDGSGREHRDPMDRIARNLDLDDAQREAFEAAMTTHREQQEPSREAMKDTRAALESAIEADEFDEGAVRAAAADVAELEADRAVARAQFRQQIREILTPEQMERFDEMHPRKHGRMGLGDGQGRRGPRGRGNRGVGF